MVLLSLLQHCTHPFTLYYGICQLGDILYYQMFMFYNITRCLYFTISHRIESRSKFRQVIFNEVCWERERYGHISYQQIQWVAQHILQSHSCIRKCGDKYVCNRKMHFFVEFNTRFVLCCWNYTSQSNNIQLTIKWCSRYLR